MNAGAAHWTALYLVPVTGVLRDVVREETPPGLTVLLLDSDSPDELARKLPLADALLVADSAVTAEVVQEAARLIPDELVRRLAFVGTGESTGRKLDWLRDEGVGSVSIFPLGSERRETIARFAELAFARA